MNNNFLEELINKKPFNIFFGAGLSVKEPSFAPTWVKIQNIFLDTLYLIIEKENWPVSDNFPHHKQVIKEFQFRPESFWESIGDLCSTKLILNVLKILSIGKPNINHKAIAYFITSGTINNAITTNFDEYLEEEMNSAGNQIQKIYNFETAKENQIKSSIYKIHGTISNPYSLQYLFSNTRSLSEANKNNLHNALNDLPLLITGYSGCDDDIFPFLKQIVKKLPLVYIISYPGSNPNEPIKQLGITSPDIHLIEADISQIFENFLKNKISVSSIQNDEKKHINFEPYLYQIVLAAISELQIPEIPFILSKLFELTGNIRTALFYSRLADDARVDNRYAPNVSSNLKQTILKQNLIIEKKLGNNDAIANYYRAELIRESDKKGKVSKAMESQFEIAWGIVFNPNRTQYEIKFADAIVNSIIAMHDENCFWGATNETLFNLYRCLGRIRVIQERYGEAINAYNEATKLMIDQENRIHPFVEAGFMLDFGTASFLYAFNEKNSEWLEKAYQAFQISKQLAEPCQDFITIVQSSIMLAQIEINIGLFDNAATTLNSIKSILGKIEDRTKIDTIKRLEILIENRDRNIMQ